MSHLNTQRCMTKCYVSLKILKKPISTILRKCKLLNRAFRSTFQSIKHLKFIFVSFTTGAYYRFTVHLGVEGKTHSKNLDKRKKGNFLQS